MKKFEQYRKLILNNTWSGFRPPTYHISLSERAMLSLSINFYWNRYILFFCLYPHCLIRNIFLRINKQKFFFLNIEKKFYNFSANKNLIKKTYLEIIRDCIIKFKVSNYTETRQIKKLKI